MSNAGPAIASLILPGLGQACQGRKFSAFCNFFLAVCVWVGTFGLLGWIINVLSAFDAAGYKEKPIKP